MVYNYMNLSSSFFVGDLEAYTDELLNALPTYCVSRPNIWRVRVLVYALVWLNDSFHIVFSVGLAKKQESRNNTTTRQTCMWSNAKHDMNVSCLLR